MGNQLLEAGEIVNTHGVKGEIKISPWCDSPDFLCQFKQLYIDNVPYQVKNIRTQKEQVIAKLAGVDDIDSALRLKGKVVFIDRDQASLPDGRFFLADLIGLEARDAESGQVLGTVDDILNLPAQDVYVIRGEKNYMIPAVDDFIVETNIEEGYIRFHMLEGMEM